MICRDDAITLLTLMYRNIPTNLITGFLGTGKTTTILHLLSQAPVGQRWAVLVNEFGRIGVDGDLIQAEAVDHAEIFVEEVAGGCLCCVGSAGMQVGLNRLIQSSKPDRILIEPTGLGHPAQLIEQLTGPYYGEVLDLRATIGLVDARMLNDPRYTSHPNFQDQLHLADVLIGNKLDCYTDADRSAFYSLVNAQGSAKKAAAMVAHGNLKQAYLDEPRLERIALFPEAHAFNTDTHHHHHGHEPPAGDWHRIEGAADGFYTASWTLPTDALFDPACVRQIMVFSGVVRMKGFLPSSHGHMRINATQSEWSEEALEQQMNPRIEMIGTDPLDWRAIEQQLRGCVENAC
ncbi:CobW family GTP-binding protein [Candidatus Thiodiazotropha endoloripes]|uniref:CobW family GTP-binding protein n=1 Tax=Candidatus Thiodiazotropha endoloripes TaxID=1818881 RepID=UPI00114D31AD|nr:GTP-binding protein [Candidatus Thiodiazotropha endoloripes]